MMVYVLEVCGNLQLAVRIAAEVESNMTAVERLDYYTSVPTEAASVVEDYRPPTGWPQQGGIVFASLDLRYRPELPLILHDFCLHVKSKEKIGICGRTGAGKCRCLAFIRSSGGLFTEFYMLFRYSINRVSSIPPRRALRRVDSHRRPGYPSSWFARLAHCYIYNSSRTRFVFRDSTLQLRYQRICFGLSNHGSPLTSVRCCVCRPF
jgi:hypothetical protein